VTIIDTASFYFTLPMHGGAVVLDGVASSA